MLDTSFLPGIDFQAPFYTVITLPNNNTITIKRLDVIHRIISGNKLFKLHYYLKDFFASTKTTLLTFGGAYSNHVLAVSEIGALQNIPVVAIIRGEKISNPVLDYCERQGTELVFWNRKDYREKDKNIQYVQECYPTSYIIPEGGTGALGIKGAMDIITQEETQKYDFIACAVGTGTMASGILSTMQNNEQNKAILWAIPVLKDATIMDTFLEINPTAPIQLYHEYHGGGYGKTNQELDLFQQKILQKYQLPLDTVYTNKLLYAVLDILQKENIANKDILVIHSGGLWKEVLN